MVPITILTPTFNRAHTLPRLARSLESQGLEGLQWVVVDDGSTDGTQDLMDRLRVTWGERLVYILHANGGKHRAINRGLGVVNTPWVWVVDSDDWLEPGALGRAMAVLDSASDQRFCGIMALRVDGTGKTIGDPFPHDLGRASSVDLYFRHGIRGDKAEIVKTEVFRRFAFPEYGGERFVTEALVWRRMATAGLEWKLVNEGWYGGEYQPGGLSDQSLRIRLESPRGNLLYYAESLALHLPGRSLWREAANLERFMAHGGLLESHVPVWPLPRSGLRLLIRPLGLLMAARDRRFLGSQGIRQGRILHVINSLAMGGAESLLSNLLPRLRARGYDAMVLVLDGWDDVWGPRLQEAGVPVFYAHRRPRSPFHPGQILAIRRWIMNLAPSVVHVHLAPAFHWAALAVGLVPPSRRPRLVATEHAVKNRRMDSAFWTSVDRRIYPRYEAVACVSPEAVEHLDRWLGQGVARTLAIANGIPLSTGGTGIPDHKVLAWKGKRHLAMITGRLVPAKDHDTFLAIMEHLGTSWCGLVVGDGPRRAELESQVLARGLGDRVRLLGTREDVPDLLGLADVSVQCSRDEGFGLAALEAMAAGVPVVASAVGGLISLVSGAGELCEPGNVKAFAQSMERIVSQDAIRSVMVQQGRDRARAFDIETTADTYGDLYGSGR